MRFELWSVTHRTRDPASWYRRLQALLELFSALKRCGRNVTHPSKLDHSITAEFETANSM